MKAVRILSLAAAGLIASGVLISTQLASAATNLVSNPGFESGLAGWSCSGGSTVGSPVHSGSAALSAAVSNSDTAQCTQNVSVVSGAQYTLTAWVQGNYVYLGGTGGASTWTPGTGGGGRVCRDVHPPPPPPPGSPRSWPYIDITMATPTLADAARATGQKFFTLAFVLGSAAGCVPAWGGTIDLNDARITKEIADLRALGGDVAVSFGGGGGAHPPQ